MHTTHLRQDCWEWKCGAVCLLRSHDGSQRQRYVHLLSETMPHTFTPSHEFIPSHEFTPSHALTPSCAFTKSHTYKASHALKPSYAFTPSHAFTPLHALELVQFGIELAP